MMHLTWQDLTVLYLPVTKDITKLFICEPPYRNGNSLHQKELDPRVNVNEKPCTHNLPQIKQKSLSWESPCEMIQSLAYTTCLKYSWKGLSWKTAPVKWFNALHTQLASNTAKNFWLRANMVSKFIINSKLKEEENQLEYFFMQFNWSNTILTPKPTRNKQ